LRTFSSSSCSNAIASASLAVHSLIAWPPNTRYPPNISSHATLAAVIADRGHSWLTTSPLAQTIFPV